MQSSPSRDRADGPSTFPLRVFRIEPGRREWLLMLSPAYDGLMTHWARGQSWYCDSNDCPPSLHRMDRFWKGYTFAHRYDEPLKLWIPCVLEISEHAELELRGRYARGQVWEFSRLPQHARKKTPVVAELAETRAEEDLGRVADIFPTLRTLYHCQSVVLGVPNPLPQKTMVAAATGEPPPGIGSRKKVAAPISPEEDARLRQLAIDAGLLRPRTNGHAK